MIVSVTHNFALNLKTPLVRFEKLPRREMKKSYFPLKMLVFLIHIFKGKYFGQKPLCFPPPLFENTLISSLSLVTQKWPESLNLSSIGAKRKEDFRFFFFVFRFISSLLWKSLFIPSPWEGAHLAKLFTLACFKS